MQNDKIKPIVGLVGVSLAGLFLLAILVFAFSFIFVEFNSWSTNKNLQQRVTKAHLIAIEANLIGSAVNKNPGYITYLKIKKDK